MQLIINKLLLSWVGVLHGIMGTLVKHVEIPIIGACIDTFIDKGCDHCEDVIGYITSNKGRM